MKKFYGLLLLMVFALAVTPAYSQANLNGSSETVEIPKASLTPAQLASIEAQAQVDRANAEVQKLEQKLETYGKWVGVGGEIGIAVKDGLTAVVDVADKFGSTNVGRFTMIMIAWKVMGKEVVQIILGLLFFFTFLITLILIYRRIVLPRKFLESNPGFFKYPKTYKIVTTELDSEGVTIVTIVFVVAFLLSIWITYAIMF